MPLGRAMALNAPWIRQWMQVPSVLPNANAIEHLVTRVPHVSRHPCDMTVENVCCSHSAQDLRPANTTAVSAVTRPWRMPDVQFSVQ